MQKTRTEEIQYLGNMLTAITDIDVERIGGIIDRLKELYMQVKPRPNPANGAPRHEYDTPIDEPPKTVWVVSGKYGADYVVDDRQDAMDYASIMAGDHPDIGPWRVVRYTAEVFC